jgi:hypothetical protein
MIPLLFLCDGPRDFPVVPRLVEKAIEYPVRPKSTPWFHLRDARGYQGKLRFAMLAARKDSLAGVVATIDADKASRRDLLRGLRDARTALREVDLLPLAVGVADPHCEAWILDDGTAVRKVLGLAAETAVPSMRPGLNAKATLLGLIHSSRRAGEAVAGLFGEIAEALALTQCLHATDTGLAAFVADVRSELVDLRPPRQPDAN